MLKACMTQFKHWYQTLGVAWHVNLFFGVCVFMAFYFLCPSFPPAKLTTTKPKWFYVKSPPDSAGFLMCFSFPLEHKPVVLMERALSLPLSHQKAQLTAVSTGIFLQVLTLGCWNQNTRRVKAPFICLGTSFDCLQVLIACFANVSSIYICPE